MAVKILFHNETTWDVDVYESVIVEMIHEAALQVELEGGQTCNYVFVDNAKMAELNGQYRGKNEPTDVLTFADETGDSFFPGDQFLGDVFISIDKMIEQSYEYGHGEVREMAFLAVHGFLHLLGYDHIDEADKEEMFALQEAILNAKDIRR